MICANIEALLICDRRLPFKIIGQAKQAHRLSCSLQEAVMEAIFWIAITVLFYTYIGYGLLLLLLTRKTSDEQPPDEGFYPPVTFIVPAYNEAAFIEEKIQNTFALFYPKGLLSFLFITDGSTDATPQLVALHPAIRLLHHPLRSGKSAAINRAMKEVTTPFVVFSDANTLLHPQSIAALMHAYKTEKIGGVSGEKRIADVAHSAVGFGERLYWKYESLLKKANGDFYTIIGAAGELFSIRTALYQPVDETVILDDFIISASVCQQGYRFLYQSRAYGIEASSASVGDESKRKIRISTGSFQALLLMKGLLNPFKNFRVAFQYFSHRVLRWTVCPVLLPLLFIANVALYANSAAILYQCCFWAQCCFYTTAVLGWFLAGKKIAVKRLYIPYYFVFMILSQYAGFYKFMTRKQSGIWEKANRNTWTGDTRFQ